jgi:hypothetical protein
MSHPKVKMAMASIGSPGINIFTVSEMGSSTENGNKNASIIKK